MAETTPQDHFETESTQALLIVVGASLRAEPADRPLAYALQQRIRRWIDQHADQMNIQLDPLVCCDLHYLSHRRMMSRPTISLGGPGVNKLSAWFANRLQAAYFHENEMLIQLDPEFIDLRVCLWGMDHDCTRRVLDVFIEQYLDRYLRAVVSQTLPLER